MPKARWFSPTMLQFKCPGCEEWHLCRVADGEGVSAIHTFNGDLEKPTLQPSVLFEGRKRCHSFVRVGVIEFLGDSQHALAGVSVALPDIAISGNRVLSC